MRQVVLSLKELEPIDKTTYWCDDEDLDESLMKMTTLRDIAVILNYSAHGIMWDLAYKIHQITGYDYDELAKAIDKIVETEEKLSIEESVDLFLSTERPKPSEKYFEDRMNEE